MPKDAPRCADEFSYRMRTPSAYFEGQSIEILELKNAAEHRVSERSRKSVVFLRMAGDYTKR